MSHSDEAAGWVNYGPDGEGAPESTRRSSGLCPFHVTGITLLSRDGVGFVTLPMLDNPMACNCRWEYVRPVVRLRNKHDRSVLVRVCPPYGRMRLDTAPEQREAWMHDVMRYAGDKTKPCDIAVYAPGIAEPCLGAGAAYLLRVGAENDTDLYFEFLFSELWLPEQLESACHDPTE